MDSGIPLFIIGFALNSLAGLPDNYMERLRGNRDVVSTFYLWTGAIGLFLTIGDLPAFLKENNISYFWFFLPFGIAIIVWVIKSWRDIIQGRYRVVYWTYFGIAGVIVTAIGMWVFMYSWIIINIHG